MLLAALGIGLGLVAALSASRALAGMVFGITVTDRATFAAVAAGLALVALVASWIPARRAAATDPAETLRTE